MAATNSSPNVDNYVSGTGIVKWKALGDTIWRDLGNVPKFDVTPNTTRIDHFSSRGPQRSRDKSAVNQRQFTVNMTLEEITADNLAMALMGGATDGVNLNTTASTHSSTVLDTLASVLGLELGGLYKATGTGIPANTYLTYNGSNAGTLSNAATSTGTAVAVVLTAPAKIEILTDTEVEGSLRFIGTNDLGAKMQVDLPSVNFSPSAAVALIQPNNGWASLEITGEVAAIANGSFGHIYWDIAAEFGP